MLQKELKNKYIGFRLPFNQYIQVIKTAQESGVSISDYILSLLTPSINRADSPPVVKSINSVKKQTEDMSEKILLDAQRRQNDFNNLKL